MIDSVEHILDYHNQLDKTNLFFVIKIESGQQNVYLKISDKKFNILEEKKIGTYDGEQISYLIDKKILCNSRIIDCDDFSISKPEVYVLEDTITEGEKHDYPKEHTSVSSVDFIQQQYPDIIAVYDLDWWADKEFLIMEKNREYKLFLGEFKLNSPQRGIIDSLLEKKEKSSATSALDDFKREKNNLEKFDDILYESKFNGAGGSCVVLPIWYYSNKNLNYYRYYYKNDTLFFKEMENSNDVTELEENHLLINYSNGNRGLIQVRKK